MLLSIQAIGSLLGGTIIGPLGKRVPPVYLLSIGSLLFGLIDLLIIDIPIFIPSLLIIAILFLLVGIPGISMSVGLNSLFQSIVEDKLLGRIFGTFFAVQALMVLIGMGLAGILGDGLGAVPMLNIQGCVYALSGLLVFLTRSQMLNKKQGKNEHASIEQRL